MAVMLFVAVAANAQQNYLQVTGDVNCSLNENARKGNFSDILGFGGTFSVGREFTPYWSAEIMAAFNQNVHMFGTEFNENNFRDFYSYELFLNGAFNLTTAFGGVNPDRKCNLNLYAGVGTAMASHLGMIREANSVTYGLRGGLNFIWAFSKKCALVASAGLTAMGDNFNGIVNGIPFDGRPDVQIGFRFNVGKNRKALAAAAAAAAAAQPKTEIQYIERLVTKVDTVRVVETVVEKVETEAVAQTVFFKINSAEIQEGELAKLETLADYLKANPDKALLVIGSADRNTGNEEGNQLLRANRARAVAEKLTEGFGIDASRVKTMTGKGDNEDLYKKEFEKNRAALCVIINLN